MDVIATDFSTFLTEAVAGTSSAFAGKPKAPDQQPLLNGLPYRLFRQSVALDERRRAGTFFSSAELSARLAAMLRQRLPQRAIAMDPTCGIGDLLLAYAALLPIEPSLNATLLEWGKQLAGMDLRPELVRMTKTRLVMLARSRGGFQAKVADIDSHFPLITVGDMLEESGRINAADGYLFNPPFGRTADHAIDTWATGKVNAAAIFLARLVAAKRRTAPIAAVLPEVLRCGSRYELFRRHLEAGGLGGGFTSLGRFDSWTDVDVFVTLLSDTATPTVWAANPISEDVAVVGDRFESRVGAVVPHRHAKIGNWYRFVCAKTTPAWSESFEPKSSRRFKGTVFKPPFVVVRRTSSPSDKRRAVGAIIVGDREVAVENHLIVLMPREGGLAACQELLAVLKHDDTSIFLNEHIRCRHLTTGSVVAIPWITKSA